MFQYLVAGVTIGASLMAVGINPVPKPSSTPAQAVKVTANVEAAPVAVAPAPTVYTVVSGDNLSAIAVTLGLESWRPLWNANPVVEDPNLIYAGEQLILPATPAPDRPVPAESAATAAALDQSSSSAVSSITSAPPTRAVNYASGSDGIFARIRQRESGGNYATNTGNGYYGAYQYDLRTWSGYAGYARPDLAPPAVQDAKAAETYAQRGCSPWPNTCY